MRRTAFRWAVGGTVGAGALLLTGCVSAPTTDSNGQDAAKPESAAPYECDLLTTQFLSEQLSTTFAEGRALPKSTEQRIECQWTAKSQIAIVTTVIDRDLGSYQKTRKESAQALGIVSKAKVPKAAKAFQVPGVGLTGMSVAGNYVQVVVSVPTATVEQVQAVAEEVAANTAK